MSLLRTIEEDSNEKEEQQPNPKRQKINSSLLSSSNPDFKHVLYECGISSLFPTTTTTTTNNNNPQHHYHYHHEKVGSQLEPNVTPSALRASIDGLLKEMHSNSIDVDNTMVLDSMDSLIMNGEYCSGDGDGDGGNNSKKALEMLWRMLLPMIVLTTKDDEITSNDVANDDANDEPHNDQTDGTTTTTTTTTNVTTNKNTHTNTIATASSSSLMKILLRIDILQPTLITILFSKLQELAMLDQEQDDDNDNDDDNDKNQEGEDDTNNNKGTKSNSNSKSNNNNNNNNIDYLTMIQEIPRLILSHIRWMDHIIQPKILTQSALECLSMLCTMTGESNDDNNNNNNNNDNDKKNDKGNRSLDHNNDKNGNNTSICRSILLDLIATLPDMIIDDETTTMYSTNSNLSRDNDNSNNDNDDDDDDDNNNNDDNEEEEEDTMTTILSTLRDVRLQDPTLLIPCLDAVSSLQLTSQEQMDSVIYDALEAIESVEESWLLPALCKFLMQNVPRAGSGGGGGGGGGTTSSTPGDGGGSSNGNSSGSGSGGSILCQKVIDSFRRLRLGQENVIDNDEDMDGREYKNQIQCNSDSEALMIEALSQGFAYRSDLTNTLLQTIKNTASTSTAATSTLMSTSNEQQQQHGPSDIWLLLCCSQAPHNKPKVKSIFKSKAISGAFYPDLIKDAIQGNTIALQSLFDSSLLFIADILVRSNERLAQNLGSILYETMFLEFDNRICRQDLIGQMIIHVNSGSYEEVDVAMKVLMNIASGGVEGVASLRIFLPFLTSLLDNIRNFHSQHLRRLFLLLFIVGMDGSCGNDDGDMEMQGVGGGGCDDVHIVIRKYLALPQIAMKHIGIIGAVCFAASCPNTSNDPAIIKDVIQMFDMVHKNCEGKEDWYSSSNHGSAFSASTLGTSAMSMFFDELCIALKGKSLAPFIKEWIQSRFASRLEDLYLADLITDDGGDSNEERLSQSEVDLILDKEDKALVKGTSNNPRAPIGDLRYNFDKEDCTVYLKLLSLHASENPFQRELLPQQLCPLLRLLSACYDERYGGEGLSEIDALIGCPILLPNESSTGIDFQDLSLEKQWTATASLFTAVSWCRELINCFVHAAAFRTINKEETQLTQLQEENRSKVTEKLRTLVELEEELLSCAEKCYHFAPSGIAILHAPKEVKELENNRQNEDTEDCDDYGDAVLLSKMTAEEKKVVAEIKKAKKVKAARKIKSKVRALKLKAKYESQLSSITQSALIPFNSDVCLALGFPELRLANSAKTSSQDLVATLGPSELRTLKVGGRLTNLLLEQLNKSLKDLFASKSKHSPFLKLQTQCQTPKISNAKDNPYNNDILKVSKKKGSRSTICMYAFLDSCVSQEVFISVHEHLAAIAEIRGNASTSDEQHDEQEIVSCARLLLRCIQTLFEAEDLFNISLGRAYLEMIVKQLSDGEQIPLKTRKPASSISLLVKYTMSLFELLEEIVIGGETNDLSFVMEGITCLKSVLQRISSVVKRLGEEHHQNKHVQTMRLKLSKLCLRLLQRNWHHNTNFNKSNIGLLVSMYLEYGSVPFKPSGDIEPFRAKNFGRVEAMTKMVSVLIDLSNVEGCKGPLASYPTCIHTTYGYYLSATVSTLSKELTLLFQSPIAKSANHTKECLNVLQTLVSLLKRTSDLTKENPPLAKKAYLLMQLKGGSKFIEVFVKYALPFLGTNFGIHEELVINIIKDTQLVTRQLSYICSHGKRIRDANLMKEGPKVKKSCEMFVHQMRSIMRKNGVLDALFSGNLRNRNIDGSLEEEIMKDEHANDVSSSSGTDTEAEDSDDDDDMGEESL